MTVLSGWRMPTKFRIRWREFGLGVALSLPALIYVVLVVTLPPQYRMVVEEAISVGWRFAFAQLLLTLHTGLAFCALRSCRSLSPVPYIVASSWLLMSFATGLAISGPSLPMTASTLVSF